MGRPIECGNCGNCRNCDRRQRKQKRIDKEVERRLTESASPAAAAAPQQGAPASANEAVRVDVDRSKIHVTQKVTPAIDIYDHDCSVDWEALCADISDPDDSTVQAKAESDEIIARMNDLPPMLEKAVTEVSKLLPMSIQRCNELNFTLPLLDQPEVLMGLAMANQWCWRYVAAMALPHLDASGMHMPKYAPPIAAIVSTGAGLAAMTVAEKRAKSAGFIDVAGQGEPDQAAEAPDFAEPDLGDMGATDSPFAGPAKGFA